VGAPLLRAVEASLAWYLDVFAAHNTASRIEDDLWFAEAEPPGWHSAAKTLAPGVPRELVLAAVEPFPRCSVADSFADLELSGEGFHLLFRAMWFVHPPLSPTKGFPHGWSVLTTDDQLVEWNAAHGTTGVLVPALLQHSRFTFLVQRRAGTTVGGAVLHDTPSAVELSNTWSSHSDCPDPGELLGCIAAARPGRPVVGYSGVNDDMFTAGFAALGPLVVWAR
jgi:hypothetical protein